MEFLITAMCQDGKQLEAVQLPFPGHQFEAILNFKARNCDILTFPNYYKVIYSYYIFRGDFKSAASWMFRYYVKIGELEQVTEVSLVEQRNALLVAINCLALVDKTNAWIHTLDRVIDIKKLREFYMETSIKIKLLPSLPTIGNLTRDEVMKVFCEESGKMEEEVLELFNDFNLN